MTARARRSLRQAWRPALVAGLACGLGATLLSLADQLILRPLPVDLDAVYAIGGLTEPPGWDNEAYWSQATRLSHLARYSSGFVNFGFGAEPRRLLVASVSRPFFEVFRLPAHRGRWPTGPREAAISFEFWSAQWGRAEDALGKEITLNGETFVVTAIAPAGFRFPGVTEAWVVTPLRSVTAGAETGLAPISGWVGRLRPGSTAGDLRGELMTMLRQQVAELNRQPGARFGVGGIAVTPLRERLGAGTKGSVAAVSVAAGLLLLIALANVFALLRVSVALRRRELAVRMALGAGGLRVALAALESGLGAAVLAAILAALTAQALGAQLAAILSAMFGGLPVFAPRVPPGALAAAGAFVLTLAAAVAAGARIASQDLLDSLRDTGAGWLPWLGARTFAVLFVAQIALSLALGAAGLATAETYAGLRSQPLGFAPGERVRLELSLLPPAYDAGRAQLARARVLDGVREAPEVREAALTSHLPLGFGAQTGMLYVSPGTGAKSQMVAIASVSDGYFRALEIPLRGRDFTSVSRGTAILSEATARRLFGDADPVGRTLQIAGEESVREVTGIAGDTAEPYREDLTFPGRMYLPMSSPYRSVPATVNLVVRCAGGCDGTLPGLRAAVRAAAPGVPGDRWQRLEDMVRQAQSPWRAVAWTLGVFAGTGLVLAAAGAFGLSSLHALARAHEIGVRVACGGTPGAIVRGLLGRLAWLAAAGCLIGVVLSRGLAEAIGRLTRDAGVLEWGVLGWSAAGCFAAVLLAAALPAVRATRRDPLAVLRGR